MSANHQPSVNRIAGLVERPPTGPSSSTLARQEAARRNGAQGHGPATPEGKRRSRSNAVRHGLLASQVQPPGDQREHDQLYRRLRNELITEFAPTAFSGTAFVDLLAADFVQLTRARQMVEALMKPAPLPSADAQQWQRLRDARRELAEVEQAMRSLEAAAESGDGTGPAVGLKVAGKVAAVIAKFVKQIQEDLAPSPDRLPTRDLDPYEKQELEQTRKIWASIRPCRSFLLDASRVAAVLSGNALAARGETKRLRSVLNHLAEAQRQWIERHRDVERRAAVPADQVLTTMANSPEKLLLLQRYITRLERSVERKLAELRRRA